MGFFVVLNTKEDIWKNVDYQTLLSINCLENILFFVQQKKEARKQLLEQTFHFGVNYPFNPLKLKKKT